MSTSSPNLPPQLVMQGMVYSGMEVTGDVAHSYEIGASDWGSLAIGSTLSGSEAA